MLAAWVQEDPAQRAFLCATRVCEILQALDWVTKDNIIELKKAPEHLYIRSLRVPLNDWKQEQLTWDSYPPGADFPVEAYISKVVAANTTIQPRPMVLYLSRGGPGSARYIINEGQLVDALQHWAQSVGASLHVLPHKHNLTRLEQQVLFYSATYVVGLHGGSFSNIVFCNKGAKVLEINSCQQRRDCFAVMALIRGLTYFRLCTPTCMAYGGGASFTLTPVDIQLILDTLGGWSRSRFPSEPGHTKYQFVVRSLQKLEYQRGTKRLLSMQEYQLLLWVSIAAAGLTAVTWFWWLQGRPVFEQQQL